MCQTYRAHRTPRHQRGACGKGQHLARGVRQTPFQDQGPGGRPPAPARSSPGSDRHPRRPPRRPHPGSPPPFRPQQPPPQPSPGTGTVDGGARESRKPAGERPRRSPPQDPREALRPRPRAPGPVRAGRRLLSARGPPALRTSLRDPLRPGCLPLVRLPGSAGQGVSRSSPPRHLHLPSQAQGPDGRPPPPVAAPHSDSHRSPCGQNGKEASRPPARLRQTRQGLRRLRHQQLAARAHRSSDPERGGAGKSPGLRGGATPALHRPPSGDHPPRPVHFWHRSVWGRRADCSESAPLPSPIAPAILPGRQWQRSCEDGPPRVCFPPSGSAFHLLGPRAGGRWEAAPVEAEPLPVF
ncbi:hypothetical protein J1605_002247 [Eschrichtius robustus]|uniref:Basic proline-rich protein-like n=1 Tax=Eschrichtius robustus TaxID=9764 RepID=A0AB34HZ11_ESCRO|nr:hypothetical protein J1605_002247 [Eschrichtius robustus]